MREAGQLGKIDQVLVADEADPNSAGMLLAAEHGIDRAPFFYCRARRSANSGLHCISKIR